MRSIIYWWCTDTYNTQPCLLEEYYYLAGGGVLVGFLNSHMNIIDMEHSQLPAHHKLQLGHCVQTVGEVKEYKT